MKKIRLAAITDLVAVATSITAMAGTQMSDTTTLTLTYQNTGSAYDSMSISELRNTLDSLEMGTQEWFAVKAILENRENGTSTGNAFYDSMSDSELLA